MPEYDGIETLEELLKIKHNLKAVLITGELREKIYERAVRSGFVDVISKPFTLDDLMSCLAEIYEGE